MPEIAPQNLNAIAQVVWWHLSYSLNHFVPEVILGSGFLLLILIDAAAPRAKSPGSKITRVTAGVCIALVTACYWRTKTKPLLARSSPRPAFLGERPRGTKTSAAITWYGHATWLTV